MRRKVYRSLDRPQAFFGIRGRYTTWMGMWLGIMFVAALLVGSMTVGFIGFIVFGAGAVVGYLYVINIQERISDRQMDKKMDARKFPTCVKRPPGPLRRMWS